MFLEEIAKAIQDMIDAVARAEEERHQALLLKREEARKKRMDIKERMAMLLKDVREIEDEMDRDKTIERY